MRVLPVLVLLPVLLAGCSELFDSHAGSQLAFLCRFLDEETERRVTVDSYGAADVTAMEALVAALENATGRSAIPLRTGRGEVPDAQDPAAVRTWTDDHPFAAGKGVHLQVAWVPRLAEADRTGEQWGPGVFAVSRQAILVAAEREGVPFSAMATGVLLHHAGHALGLVNGGAPVASTDHDAREGAPGHAADPDSIMHISWEASGAIRWRGDPAYSADDRADWAAARSVTCQA